mgnify:CR=1 FL=1
MNDVKKDAESIDERINQNITNDIFDKRIETTNQEQFSAEDNIEIDEPIQELDEELETEDEDLETEDTIITEEKNNRKVETIFCIFCGVMLCCSICFIIYLYMYNNTNKNYDDKKNERRITQFVMNTTMRYPELHKNFAPKVVYSTKPVKMSKAQESLWKSYFSGNIKTELLSPGSGYTILRINNSGIFADYYNVNQKPVTFRLR